MGREGEQRPDLLTAIITAAVIRIIAHVIIACGIANRCGFSPSMGQSGWRVTY